MMLLKKHWILQAEANQSEGSSSNQTPTPSAAEAVIPATVPAMVELPAGPADAAIMADENVGGEGSATDWDKIFAGEEAEEQAERVTGPVETPAPPAEVKPAATPSVPSVATPGVVAQPAVPAVAQPVAATPQPAVATPAATPTSIVEKTQAERDAEAQAAYAKYEGELVSYYKLPEEMAEQLEAEPQVVLPQLAAKLHMTIRNEVLAELNRTLPQTLAYHQQADRANAEAKSTFYGRHPDLAPYEQQVIQTGMWYRSMNPTATPDQAIEAIGNLVRTALSLQAAPGTAPAAVTPPPAATPRPQSAGFRPGGAGGGGPARASAPANPYEAMAEEFMADDLGG